MRCYLNSSNKSNKLYQQLIEEQNGPMGNCFLLVMILIMVFAIAILVFSPDSTSRYRGYKVIDKGRWGKSAIPTLVLKGPDGDGDDRIVSLAVNNDNYYYYDIGDEFE